MRITIAYNLRTDDSEATAEHLGADDVTRIHTAIVSLGHTVTDVEVSGKSLRGLRAQLPDRVFRVNSPTPSF